MVPPESLVRFKVPGGGAVGESELIEQEKFACSKKCKKVAKFGFILKMGSESEALKAFESMMRKKMNKKNLASGAGVGVVKLNLQTSRIISHR
jgi:hypothetical protein